MASRWAVPALSSITTTVPSGAFAVMSMKPEATERSAPPTRPAGAPAPPAARSSRRAESSPQGPITPSSVNQTGPMFMRVQADNRLDRRRGFASKSAGIEPALPGAHTDAAGDRDRFQQPVGVPLPGGGVWFGDETDTWVKGQEATTPQRYPDGEALYNGGALVMRDLDRDGLRGPTDVRYVGSDSEAGSDRRTGTTVAGSSCLFLQSDSGVTATTLTSGTAPMWPT